MILKMKIEYELEEDEWEEDEEELGYEFVDDGYCTESTIIDREIED